MGKERTAAQLELPAILTAAVSWAMAIAREIFVQMDTWRLLLGRTRVMHRQGFQVPILSSFALQVSKGTPYLELSQEMIQRFVRSLVDGLGAQDLLPEYCHAAYIAGQARNVLRSVSAATAGFAAPLLPRSRHAGNVMPFQKVRDGLRGRLLVRLKPDCPPGDAVYLLPDSESAPSSGLDQKNVPSRWFCRWLPDISVGDS